MHSTTRLANGLQVVTASMTSTESVALGLWAAVGSRHEPSSRAGISHFLEHLLFKGTARRNARAISQDIEGIGGYVNAFTGEEATCFYARAGYRHFPLLLDVLSDMYRRPRLAPAEIGKERAVIKEELLMFRDQPAQHVHELLVETLWQGHPLGRPIAGTAAAIEAINRPMLRQHLHCAYHPSRTVVAVAGRCRHDEVVRHVQAAFAGRSRTVSRLRFRPAADRQRAPRLRFLVKDVEQAQLALGVRSCSRHDRRRYALRLLSVLLGENMSSRLFQVLREDHGLVYAIQSSTSFFADTGALVVSAGLDAVHVDRALALILRELRRLAGRAPSPRELQRAQDYSIGQMWLGLESSANQMMWLGEHLLVYGSIESPGQVERRVRAITPEEIRAVAADLFRNERFSLAVISPRAQDEARLRRRLRGE